MSERISFYIEHTIPGFLYTASCFFIYLSFFGIDDLSIFKRVDDYLPYIFIGLLVIASIVGYTCQKILENIIYLFCKEYKYDAKNEMKVTKLQNELIRRRMNHFYIVLVLFRHLILGTSILYSSVIIWLWGSSHTDEIAQISFIFIIIIIPLGLVYFLHRRTFNQFKKEINYIFQSD